MNPDNHIRTPEQHYNDIGGVQYDKLDKKSPHFDWYQMMEFAASYGKICVEQAAKEMERQRGYGGMSTDYIVNEIKKQIDSQ